MARLRLGLLFTFNPVWMGGLIYLQNIVRILGFLEDSQKPHITVYYKPELLRYVEELDYPYLDCVPIKYPSIGAGVARSWLTGRNQFIDHIWKRGEADVLFPVKDLPVRSTANGVAWFADLQHRHFPNFFKFHTRLGREARLKLMFRNCQHLLVSSQSVVDDLHRFYSVPDSLKLSVYRFVSPVSAQPETVIRRIRKKYGAECPFFIVSNQFHRHKNHRTVVRAFGLAGSALGDSHLLLTGKLPRDPNSHYLGELKEIIREFDLGDRVHFLGLIPRGDQLGLMQSAVSVVQPSLFEGWSTVVEDAKSLQVPVIASDLPVHKEQLGSSAVFFPPLDANLLAENLIAAQAQDIEQGLRYEPMHTRAKTSAIDLYAVLSSYSPH